MASTPNPAPSATYPMASLYVGDLAPDVVESTLFEKFSAAGPVLSVRVCRDAVTRRSLGYSYINFQQPADAERALDTFNFDVLNGKAMRIMWSQRDPATRRSGAGNVFIKNLEKVIDNKSMYDTFSLFGNILSCKVAVDEEGNSKGYGFVHFETEDAANRAIEKVNGMLLAGKKVFVGKFQPRSARMREMGESAKRFTNVFVKNLAEDVDTAKLEKMFSPFGAVTSCAVMTDSEGKSKGFGFVAFEEPESAEKAVNELNEKVQEGTDKKLYVGRAQKKSERQAELKRKFEMQKAERIQRYQGVNLYVKNLDDTVEEAKLREAFQEYGNITSCKIMCDENGRSKGFGFVCFEKPDEATKAVTEMNGKMIFAKPLYVALAQRKEDRRAQLASLYMARLANMRLHSQVPATMYTPGNGGYFVNSMNTNRGGFVGGGMQGRIPGAANKWSAQGGFNNGGGYIMQGGMQAARGRGGPAGAGARPFSATTGVPRGGMQPGMRQPQAQPMMRGPGGPRPPMQAGAPKPYPAYATAAAPQPQPQRGDGIVVRGQQPLSAHELAQAGPQEQKQLLGERIYSLIEEMYGSNADVGKMTGMMLEMDNSDLVMILQDKDLFASKVNEAAQVLKSVK